MSELVQVKQSPPEQKLKASDILIGAEGEVKQVRGALHKDGGYCANGVLFFNAGLPIENDAIPLSEFYNIPTGAVIVIADMNDTGKSFREIGEYLKGMGY